MLKMPIFHASVHIYDAESDIFMNIILKYNTYIIKSHRHRSETFHLIFHHVWTFLYGPVLLVLILQRTKLYRLGHAHIRHVSPQLSSTTYVKYGLDIS